MWYICDFFTLHFSHMLSYLLLWFFFWLSYVLKQYFEEQVRVAQEFYYNELGMQEKINRNVEDGCMLLIFYVFSSL